MSEQPGWCRGIDCSNYLGSGRCRLKEWVNRGYVSGKRRMEVYDEFRRMTDENPKKLRERCNRRAGGG